MLFMPFQMKMTVYAGVEINTGPCPVARAFSVGQVKSAINWPGWPVKL